MANRGRPRKNPEAAPVVKSSASKSVKPTAPKAYTHDDDKRLGLPSGGTAGKADRILALVEKAGREPLSPEEKKLFEEALRKYQPWLEWSGKREAAEKGYFEVDPVALSIHERVSPQAILRAARREDVQRELFAEPRGVAW